MPEGLGCFCFGTVLVGSVSALATLVADGLAATFLLPAIDQLGTMPPGRRGSRSIRGDVQVLQCRREGCLQTETCMSCRGVHASGIAHSFQFRSDAARKVCGPVCTEVFECHQSDHQATALVCCTQLANTLPVTISVCNAYRSSMNSVRADSLIHQTHPCSRLASAACTSAGLCPLASCIAVKCHW